MIKTARNEAILKTTHSTFLISEFLKERRKVIGTIALWMNPFWAISPEAFKGDIVENIEKVLKQYPGFDSIHFLNRRGVVAWGVPESRSLEGVSLLQDISHPERYGTLLEKARKMRTPLLSPLCITEFNPQTGKLAKVEMLLIATPVYRNETYFGSLLAIMRVDAIGRHFFPPSRGEHVGFWVVMDGKGNLLYANAGSQKILPCIKKFSRKTKASRSSYSGILNCGRESRRGESFLVSWAKLPVGFQNDWCVIRAFPLHRIESETHLWLWQIRGIAFVAIAIMVLTAVFLLVSFQRSEKKLDSLNRKYRDLLDNLLVGTFTFDASSGKIDYVNHRACELLGYEPEDLIGKDRLFFAWDKERSEIDVTSRQRMKGERVAEGYRSHMVHRSGRVIDVEIFASPVRDEKGRVQSVRVMFRDITRQMEMEKEIQTYTRHLEDLVQERTRALRESEALYRSIFETSLAIIYIHQDNRFKVMNKAGMTFFGFKSREEMLQANVWDTIPEGERERRRRNALLRISGEKVPSRYESLVINRDGEVRVVECSFQRTIFRDEPAILAILFDVTEKKKMEAEIVHTERLKSMGQLATGVAHDFNNILSAILGRIQLLKQHPQDVEMVVSCARLVEQAVEQGTNAIRRIQEVTRVRRDRSTSKPLPLHRIIEDAIGITRYSWKDQAQKRGATIQIEKELNDENHPFPSELHEVFMNLILNAVDAMPRGGTLRIETQPVKSQNGQGRVRVIFEDTGEGMPPEVLKHALEPFYTTKGAKGTGLGLSIVSEAVSRLGGTIDIKSKEGEGTRVILEIPLGTKQKIGEGQEPRPLPGREAGVKKNGALLIVDDEPALTEIFEDLFESKEIDVVTANSGEEALATFSENPERFALIFTDLGMPKMNGWEFVRRVREVSEDIPIVLMTGWGLEISEEDMASARVSEVISKPLTIQTILDTVSRYTR